MKLIYDFHCRFLHILWEILPKKYELIRGINIPYLKLPSFLLGRRRTHYDSWATVLHHKTSGKIMIFTTGEDPFLRYTVYHEYCEGEGYRQSRPTYEILKSISEKTQLILEVYKGTEKGAPINDPLFFEYIWIWVEYFGIHVEALLKEIELAKEELPQEKISLYFQDIIEKDRFAINLIRQSR